MDNLDALLRWLFDFSFLVDVLALTLPFAIGAAAAERAAGEDWYRRGGRRLLGGAAMAAVLAAALAAYAASYRYLGLPDWFRWIALQG